MRFLCPTCERLAYASGARVAEDTVYVTCGRCGAEAAVMRSDAATPPQKNGARSRSATANPVAPGSTPAPFPAPPQAYPGHTTPAPFAAATPQTAASAPWSTSSMPPTASSRQPPAASTSGAAPTPAAESPTRVVALRAVTDAVRLAADAARSSDPFAIPDDRCPKCVSPRPAEALACPHCGLVYVNYVPEETAPSPELETAFRSALERWDDSELQEKVLALATRRGELPALGRLYRLRQAAAPMDPVAQRGRDEVLRRAAAASEALRTLPPRNTGSRRVLRAAMAVLAVVMLVLLVALTRQLLRAP